MGGQLKEGPWVFEKKLLRRALEMPYAKGWKIILALKTEKCSSWRRKRVVALEGENEK